MTLDEPPVVGQFVRVRLVGEGRFLSLAEVQVMALGENAALHGVARQSTTGYGGVPGRAIDGNTDGAHSAASVTHTERQTDPWWEVDLGGPVPISSVSLFNRTDCCAERWNGWILEVLDAGRDVVWAFDSEQDRGRRVDVRLGGPRRLELTVRDGWTEAADSTARSSPSRQSATHEPVWLLRSPLTLGDGQQLRLSGEAVEGAAWEVSGDPTWSRWLDVPPEAVAALGRPVDRRDPAERRLLQRVAFDTMDSRREARRRRDALVAERDDVVRAGSTSVMVMADRPGVRQTHVLPRGLYDTRGEVVTADVPAVLPPLRSDLPRTRLGLARWLTRGDHPLTARVFVNRLWAMCFGRGLVPTLDNFGTQGSYPSHPELLDWLAAEFVRAGWDVQHLLRTILTSETYRQRSDVSSDREGSADPDNRWLARGPRFRLDAECIRDAALAASGLLDRTVGGPSVYPYQPPGLWQEINNRPGYSRPYPQPDLDHQHRRSVYTYWKRTLPPPTMQLFDAPNREICTASRSRTNTPLQALALLHDPQFVEAARVLAGRAWRSVSGVEVATVAPAALDRRRLDRLFEWCTQRVPDDAEAGELLDYLREERRRFGDDRDAAVAALAVGLSPRDARVPATEHAAWMSVARLVLNLSEVVTRR